MNFAKMMKQAQQMQSQMQKVQEEIASAEFEGTAGGGAVAARATGDGQLVAVKISPEALKQGDAELLEEMILAAANAALHAGREEAKRKMGSITAGLGIPGMGM